MKFSTQNVYPMERANLARVPPPTQLRATAPDGTGIAVTDLGGDGPDLLLVHATGMCGAVLHPMARRLSAHFRCVTLDQRAHGDSDRPAGGRFAWTGFAEDVLAVIDSLSLDRPLAFGHSAGGAALLLAEERRPGTFAALYCYEPVVYPGDDPLPPSREDNPLAQGALRRRSSFESRDAAIRNFSSKPPFDVFDAEVLGAYVDSGFEADGDGSIHLKCAPSDEADVYAHGFSHDAFSHLHKVACPVTLAYGKLTDAFNEHFLALLAERMPAAEVLPFHRLGHFGPLQDPAAVAESIANAAGFRRNTPMP
jgi:pimeloyl-ACP methyl ester carboxylesterase